MNKIYIITGLLICILFVGCDNWSDDYNENKNIPKVLSGDPSTLMDAMITGPIGGGRMEWVAYNSIQPVVGYIGRTASLSQGARHRAWHDFDGNVWPYCYQTMTQVKNVRKAATEAGKFQYVAIADIYESWIMYTMTNFYGDIPYFAAVQDTLVYTVDYDRQSDIYVAILEKLKSANELIAANPENVDGVSDYIYQGDMGKWRKLSNTLRVRMCMHMYNVDPESSRQILSEILNDPQKYPVFTSNEDNCYIHNDGSTDRRTSMFGREPNTWEALLMMSNVMIERLISLSDPRLPLYAYPAKKVHTEDHYFLPTNPGIDKYIGHMYGLTTSDSDATIHNGGAEYSSKVGPWFRALDANGVITDKTKSTPFILVTYAEMLFFLSEASQRGIIAGDAKQYYESGVKAAFEQFGASFASADYYGAFADEGLNNESEYLQQQQVNWNGGRDKLTLIAEQKWIACFFMVLEPYFDHRRTMLPKLSCSERAGLYTDGSGTKFPSRADYPASEEFTNADGWSKARASGFDIPITGDNNRTLARMWIINNDNNPSLLMPVFVEPLNSEGEYPGGNNFKTWYTDHSTLLYWWKYE